WGTNESTTRQTGPAIRHVVPPTAPPLQRPVSSSRQSSWKECYSPSAAGPVNRPPLLGAASSPPPAHPVWKSSRAHHAALPRLASESSSHTKKPAPSVHEMDR